MTRLPTPELKMFRWTASRRKAPAPRANANPTFLSCCDVISHVGPSYCTRMGRRLRKRWYGDQERERKPTLIEEEAGRAWSSRSRGKLAVFPNRQAMGRLGRRSHTHDEFQKAPVLVLVLVPVCASACAGAQVPRCPGAFVAEKSREVRQVRQGGRGMVWEVWDGNGTVPYRTMRTVQHGTVYNKTCSAARNGHPPTASTDGQCS